MTRVRNANPNAWIIKSIAFLILVILVIFGYALSGELSKKKKIENEIDILKQEAEKIQKENMKLEERISYLSSDEYKRIEAKDKLNLKSPDEKLVIIAKSPTQKNEQEPPQEKNITTKSEKISNYQKWWKYFFE